MHGGLYGVRDPGLLSSALARPRNAWAYGEADVCTLAAFYGAGIIKNHPFLDGNKRTGLVAVELFLDLNGFTLVAEDVNVLAVILALASGTLDEAGFAHWLRAETAPI